MPFRYHLLFQLTVSQKVTVLCFVCTLLAFDISYVGFTMVMIYNLVNDLHPKPILMTSIWKPSDTCGLLHGIWCLRFKYVMP